MLFHSLRHCTNQFLNAIRKAVIHRIVHFVQHARGVFLHYFVRKS